jgi:Ca-activated chloride channel family protein
MRYNYSRFTGDELDDLDLEELMAKLSDMLLASGFGDADGFESVDPDDAMQQLHDAILEALLSGELLPAETVERLLNAANGSERLDELIRRIIERLEAGGYITTSPDLDAHRRQRQSARPGGFGEDSPPVRFELTDKGLDFLGYRALRDLLGTVGRSSLGRHDTREMATSVETIGSPKPYEFGDTLNIDASGTILNAIRRGAEGRGDTSARPASSAREAREGHGGVGINIRHEDLMVSQGEFESSCATVLMLDCSHSMILYGEDRFTPAKRVALALSTLIRTQYPGDALHVVLFHDSAEEIPLRELARVQVGPFHTNTREGLRLSRRILDRQRKDMRQIIMITDGKPSAVTQADGRIYMNPMGLDPLIVTETLAEVAACRRSGIQVNTFMLARDFELVSFVRRVAELCRGKAYFTTPHTLGQYVLMDYLGGKTRTIH